MICNEHGIETSDGGWICPVCSSERCRECESFECAVDGKMKDPECCFRCEFCDSQVGIDHKIKCSVCGVEGCTNCISACAIDGKLVCPDCGSICSDCGKTFCNEHLTKCEVCPSKICSECGAHTCHICGAKVCRQHSFKCDGCGEYTCKSCLGSVDSTEDRKLCKKCTYACPSCGRFVDYKQTLIDSETGERLCVNCIKKCARCQKILKKDELTHCAICKEYVCREDSAKCPSCGQIVCKEHLIECEACGIKYCKNCISEDTYILCSGCAYLKPLSGEKAKEILEKAISGDSSLKGFSGWRCSEGKDVSIYYGKSILAHCIAAVDNQTGKVISFKKIGLFDNLRKILR